MRRLFPACLAAGLALAALAAPADAALQKYALKRTHIINREIASPNPDSDPACDFGPQSRVDVCLGRALIDAEGPAPVLNRLVFVTDATSTITVNPLNTSIFWSSREREGPASFATGSGNTTSGSTLRWGVVSGWTLSGTIWCNSNPAVICSLAGAMDEATTDPPPVSSFYDLGTWSFHGTGFTSAPFIYRTFTNDHGNVSDLYRGARADDGTVPALPALGVAVLGGLLAGGAAAALRRGPPRGR